MKITTWTYAVGTAHVANVARLTRIGEPVTIVRTVDHRTVVVRFRDGLCAPVSVFNLEGAEQ